MTVSYVQWTPEEAKAELSKRLEAARRARRHLEIQWTINERAVFATSASQDSLTEMLPSALTGLSADAGGRQPDLTVSYCMKNTRFLHSQMSANPPVVQVSPASSDQEDRRAADAADRLVRYAPRQYKMANTHDLCNLNVLVSGTAIGKTVFDENLGLPTAFDAERNAIRFEGDFKFSNVHYRKFFMDPDATNTEDVIWVFEQIDVPVEKACAMFPAHEAKFKALAESMQNSPSTYQDFLQTKRFSRIPLYQYWEDGTPETGCKGRFAWCLEDGEVLNAEGTAIASPYAFEVFDADGTAIGTYAKLPYHIYTDIDVPGTAWGQSVVSYAAPIQDYINKIDNVSMDILQAHGVARMAVPDSAEISDEAITNNNWDVVVYAGNVAPHFMEPLPFPAALTAQREVARKALDDIFGVTEGNMGIQKRETANAAMQYAVEQSNLVRKRLFNKMTMFVESVYSDYLSLIANNWSTSRTIKVVGREKAMEVLDIKGADIRSGYDVICEYGTSLPLDPMARQAMIIQNIPLLKEAGMKPRTIIGKLRLGELESTFDAAQMSEDRQREYFEEIISEQIYVAPGELEDNTNMLDYAMQWRMSAEFKNLPPEVQGLCLQHIKARKELAAADVVPAAPEAGPSGAAPGAGGPDGALAAMFGAA